MENNLVRTAELLGGKKNIVGGTNADLILETLGKIYVKSGKQTRLLNDVFKLLDEINGNNISNKVITTNDIDLISYPGDGYLVFDTKNKGLYISYDQRYLLIVDSIDDSISEGTYVKKSGDVMTGPLKIVHKGAPLVVASKELVKNFNADYFQGHDADYFAVKELDEFIYGVWSFFKDTTFNQNVKILGDTNIGKNLTVIQSEQVYGNSTTYGNKTVKGMSQFEDNAQFDKNIRVQGDIVTTGSISSPYFMSGYNGYGWRFDATTNTLTVDYLVVRKAMNVFELIVNQISATNGSLWVTDSGEIDEVYDVKLIQVGKQSNIDWAVRFSKNILDTCFDYYYIPYKSQDDYNYANETVGETSFYNFKYLCKFIKPNADNDVIIDLKNLNNIEQIGVFFKNSDTTTLTHIYESNQYREAREDEIPELVKKVYYIEAKSEETATHRKIAVYRRAEEGEIAQYVYELGMYRLAIEGEVATYVFDTKTGEYREPVGDEIAMYIWDDEIGMYRLAKKETATHIWDESLNDYRLAEGDEIATHVLDETIGEYRYPIEEHAMYVLVYQYVPAEKNEATYIEMFEYREPEEGETPTYIQTEGGYRKANQNEIATHIEYENAEGIIQYLTLDEYSVLNPIINTNLIYNTNTTPRIFAKGLSVNDLESYINESQVYQNPLYLYYKYFGNKTLSSEHIKVIKMKDDKIPPFKEGDIVRCQKFQDGNIKYYDALIAGQLNSYTYIIITAESVFDKQTTIEYNADGSIKNYTEVLNKTQYEKTPQNYTGDITYGESDLNKENFDENKLIAGVAAGDGIVRIGHLYDRDRQNSVYITSSEMNSPYIQTISGVCRPDYSVLYAEPEFKTNSIGYYEFSANQVPYIETSVTETELVDGTQTEVTRVYKFAKLKTYKGEETFKISKDVFYAPNYYYFADFNGESNKFIIANLNKNDAGLVKLKVNNNVRTRLGNLNGIVDPVFKSKQPYGYGLFADNVFLKGEFILNSGQSIVEFTKDYLNMQVGDKESGMFSQVYQDLNEIRNTVSEVDDRFSEIRQTANEINLSVDSLQNVFEVPKLKIVKQNNIELSQDNTLPMSKYPSQQVPFFALGEGIIKWNSDSTELIIENGYIIGKLTQDITKDSNCIIIEFSNTVQASVIVAPFIKTDGENYEISEEILWQGIIDNNMISITPTKDLLKDSMIVLIFNQNVTIQYPIRTNIDIDTKSLLEVSENNISIKLENTGIDITNNKIHIKADNTEFDSNVTINANLELHDINNNKLKINAQTDNEEEIVEYVNQVFNKEITPTSSNTSWTYLPYFNEVIFTANDQIDPSAYAKYTWNDVQYYRYSKISMPNSSDYPNFKLNEIFTLYDTGEIAAIWSNWRTDTKIWIDEGNNCTKFNCFVVEPVESKHLDNQFNPLINILDANYVKGKHPYPENFPEYEEKDLYVMEIYDETKYNTILIQDTVLDLPERYTVITDYTFLQDAYIIPLGPGIKIYKQENGDKEVSGNQTVTGVYKNCAVRANCFKLSLYNNYIAQGLPNADVEYVYSYYGNAYTKSTTSNYVNVTRITKKKDPITNELEPLEQLGVPVPKLACIPIVLTAKNPTIYTFKNPKIIYTTEESTNTVESKTLKHGYMSVVTLRDLDPLLLWNSKHITQGNIDIQADSKESFHKNVYFIVFPLYSEDVESGYIGTINLECYIKSEPKNPGANSYIKASNIRLESPNQLYSMGFSNSGFKLYFLDKEFVIDQDGMYINKYQHQLGDYVTTPYLCVKKIESTSKPLAIWNNYFDSN